MRKAKPPRYPKVFLSVKRTSTEDDILGAMGNALRTLAQASQDEINEFYTLARRGDRTHLLAVCRQWVNLKETR